MDRREFVKASGAVLAASALGEAVPLDPTLSRQERAGQGRGTQRTVVPLSQDWRFSPTRSAGDTSAAFDDRKFELVTLPHTNKLLPWHSFDEKSYQFKSIYRKHFTLPVAATAGRRVFVDFEGAMTASTVWLNGQRLGEYKGGYTPFSFELTPHLSTTGENVLAVELDSSELADTPPFGGAIDYLTFGGIYREVWLRAVPQTYIENVRTQAKDVLSGAPGLEVEVFVAGGAERLRAIVELRDGQRVIGTGDSPVPTQATAGAAVATQAGETAVATRVVLAKLQGIKLWDLNAPNLYTVSVRLQQGTTTIDEYETRIGFRDAKFTERGFQLNGKVVKLRGLNRHQTFPWVGQAMAARGQRRDAWILKKELKINIVRTSHYPQSRHFLDACDELGLLVLEEIPGWQHVGNEEWQERAVDNVRRMVRRDWNHPAIILWGVRINESRDDHNFYTRTNEVARALDPSRQTGGIRYNYSSELLEDVFTMNDFGFPLRPPNHPLYLNTEFVGHTYPTKPNDPGERLTEHGLRHARIHDQLASDARYAGGLGWCAFDYDTHNNFGSGERVCYHGVSDIFRIAKPAASFYRSQCDPADEIILEPAFDWSAQGDWSGPLDGEHRNPIIWSNCEHVKVFVGDELAAEADADRAGFPNLTHPPFKVTLRRVRFRDMRIEGYIGGKKVAEKMLSSKGVDERFELRADDSELRADGADATRLVFRVTDEFGNQRRYTSGVVTFKVEGPAEIVGDNPFALVAGCGAVWIKAKRQAGDVTVTATHAVLGQQQVRLAIKPSLGG